MSAPGQTPVTNENEKETEQEITFSLYPVPNKEKLNDYKYLPAGISDELKESIVKQNMDLLSVLNQSYEDSLPVQGDIRAGMKSAATQDKLEMTYEYSGNKQILYAAMLGVNAGMTKENKIFIKMILTAGK